MQWKFTESIIVVVNNLMLIVGSESFQTSLKYLNLNLLLLVTNLQLAYSDSDRLKIEM